MDRSVDHLFRHQASRIVATLTRVFGIAHLELAEDVVQEALYRALRQWPYRGVPRHPAAWITRVARNRALDLLRRQGNWQSKKAEIERALPTVDEPTDPERLDRELLDDQLAMVFACCHPALKRPSQVALTLKIVGAFSTAEIARALLARESTIGQRIVRAKRRLRRERQSLRIPAGDELPRRLDSVLEVIYLLFNEGYSSHSGDNLLREELCQEALRLLDLLRGHPATDRPETHALAALVYLQASRLPTRVDQDGDLLLLEHQDRSRWDRRCIEAGIRALARSARGDRLTAYHLEAEISACHALAKDFESTDWGRILDCYDRLLRLKPSPIVALNRLVPLAKVHGAETALAAWDDLLEQPQLRAYYPAWTIRGELLLWVCRPADASHAFRQALDHTGNATVRRHLRKRMAAAGEAGNGQASALPLGGGAIG